ncbi:MAG: class I SAM-dependent methyltransferase [Candidatus Omnitrophica bacterium]|nr:class I SAM-dependent methyltransferase [Candidatus Omnitrophota bacterium]
MAKYLISKNQDLCVEGIDINEEALNMAKKLCPGAVFRKDDITDLKYPDKSFDLILAIEVLEHLKDPGMIIREAKRISSRYCIFSVPLEPFFKICNFLRGKNIRRWGNPPEHLQGWSLRQFRSLLSSNFDKVNIKVVFPWTIALCEV